MYYSPVYVCKSCFPDSSYLLPLYFIIRNSLSGIWIFHRINGICRKDHCEYHTEGGQNLKRYLLDHIVQKRRQDIDQTYTPNSEYKKSLCADPPVQIQKISAVIPPSFPVVSHFQIIGGKYSTVPQRRIIPTNSANGLFLILFSSKRMRTLRPRKSAAMVREGLLCSQILRPAPDEADLPQPSHEGKDKK